MCFHCRHTPGCWLKGFSYNNHQILLLGCKPQTWAFPRCPALRGAALLAASHMLESNWISPPSQPSPVLQKPCVPSDFISPCLRGLSPVSVSPTRFTYSCSRSFSGLSAPSPRRGCGFSPSRGPGSSPSPGSPLTRCHGPKCPQGLGRGGCAGGSPLPGKIPPNCALGARCWVLSASSSAPERNVLKLPPKACPLVHGMLLQPCKFISQVASLPPPQLAP